MPDRSKLDDAAWLEEQYAAASSETIAKQIGVAPETVRRALRRHGIPVRDRWSSARLHMPPELDDARWLRHQYEAGKTAAQIADELGVSEPVVHKSMRRLGIDLDGA